MFAWNSTSTLTGRDPITTACTCSPPTRPNVYAEMRQAAIEEYTYLKELYNQKRSVHVKSVAAKRYGGAQVKASVQVQVAHSPNPLARGDSSSRQQRSANSCASPGEGAWKEAHTVRCSQ